MGTFVSKAIKISLPFVLGVGILWWMYRGTDWVGFVACIVNDMHWGWMLLSLLFGILPQMIRAWRWRMTLEPLGEKPSGRVCADSIFLSYAASLVIPRIGEVTRCGTLKTYEGTSFTKALGTVVTERVVDSIVMLLLTGATFLWQLPAFVSFLTETGTDFGSIFGRFTGAGYLVTLLCGLLIVASIAALVWKLKMFHKGREAVGNLWQGIRSLRSVKNLPLYLIFSVGIWLAYFLHFYLAFFCFDFTAGIPLASAFLIFCIGSFAVLVPTPNGAGPWHFAVKTMLVLCGVAESSAILFALVVHTLQTSLVVLLGAYGWADLNFLKQARKSRKQQS